MSGIVALGIAASAAQMVAYGKSIIVFLANVYERVEEAPQQYREYETQLKLLINLAQNITKTRSLQNLDVQYHLDSALVEVRALQSILCSPTSGFAKTSETHNYWKLIKGTEQKQILAHLDRLNKKNLGLLLSITTVNSAQISSVQGGVEKLIEMSDTRLQSSAENLEKEDVSSSETLYLRCFLRG